MEIEGCVMLAGVDCFGNLLERLAFFDLESDPIHVAHNLPSPPVLWSKKSAYKTRPSSYKKTTGYPSNCPEKQWFQLQFTVRNMLN